MGRTPKFHLLFSHRATPLRNALSVAVLRRNARPRRCDGRAAPRRRVEGGGAGRGRGGGCAIIGGGGGVVITAALSAVAPLQLIILLSGCAATARVLVLPVSEQRAKRQRAEPREVSAARRREGTRKTNGSTARRQNKAGRAEACYLTSSPCARRRTNTLPVCRAPRPRTQAAAHQLLASSP
jgi:hypothetical protein